MQEIRAVLSMELLALALKKENLFFMKPFHVREKRTCFQVFHFGEGDAVCSAGILHN